MNSGIYKILNLVTGQFYIGSAVDFNRRWNKHRRELNGKIHPNAYLQNAWNKYSEIAFEFSIVQRCEKIDLVRIEQIYLDLFKSYNRQIGYNICIVADNRTGVLHTEATKSKMSVARKGLAKSPEWQAQITAAITGLKRDVSVGKAHGERMRGRKFSPETRERMRLGQLGRKHSLESREKRSEKLKGRVIRPKAELA